MRTAGVFYGYKEISPNVYTGFGALRSCKLKVTTHIQQMCRIYARHILPTNRTKENWKILVEDTFDHILGIKSDFEIGPPEIGPGHCGVYDCQNLNYVPLSAESTQKFKKALFEPEVGTAQFFSSKTRPFSGDV